VLNFVGLSKGELRMKKGILFQMIISLLFVAVISSCGGSSNKGNTPGSTVGPVVTPPEPPTTPVFSGGVVANHTIATEAMLRAIPVQYINAARTTLAVAYQHTSHGTHVTVGAYGLQDYKTGDATLFGVSNTRVANKLYFDDCYNTAGTPLGNGVIDLSNGVDNDAVNPSFIVATRAYLDDAANADVNVVMWSWCSISGHTVQNYLNGMQTLINEYGPGGSKIGTSTGQTRTTPVTFVFMTGHAEFDSNIGAGHPRDQAQLIIDYCATYGYLCLDYYNIDTHDMAGNYWEDTGDNGDSTLYGTATGSLTSNFYQDWQNSHTLGTDWFENKAHPGDTTAVYGDHNTQHITANRKAYAFWWILARIAGWDGVSQN
jgi:hypothetical protein